MSAPAAAAVTTRRLLAIAPAAVAVGVGSSLVLVAVLWVAEKLHHLLWAALPESWGIDTSARWWIITILTLTGLATGLVIAFVPGHAGRDPATESLVAPPEPPGAIPGLLIAVCLTLAGGVSLGPENPVIGTNIALAIALGAQLTKPPRSSPKPPRSRNLPGNTPPGSAPKRNLPGNFPDHEAHDHGAGDPGWARLWMGMAASGTIGAMFGTPVAAALVLSESPADDPSVPLWDRMFAPLVAAGAGALTTQALESPNFSIDVAPYPGFHFVDLISACCVAVVGALTGLAVVYPFPLVHRAFQRVPATIARLTLGGLVLGLLGAAGGLITLFKGLNESRELVADAATYTIAGMLLVLVVKACALLVAASCGFRGGRIFPATFMGVAIGLLANRMVPGIPVGLAIACAVLGLVMAITQQGWMSLFLAVTVVLDIRVLPLLCLAVLPVWLVVRGRPQMRVPQSQV